MAKKTREFVISMLLDQGEDLTEENIQAAMGSHKASNDDQMMADAFIKSIQSLRDNSNIPMAIVKLGMALAKALEVLAAAFRSHSHSIVVNPTPVNIDVPTPSLPMPLGEKRKTIAKVNRDQNGLIDTVEFIEE